ncbi:MAG: PEP/pyruvate-binding domain-containing protein [Hyphomicrobiales bacterium]
MYSRLIAFWRHRRQAREKQALEELKARYHAFRIFLENNGRALELIGALDGALDVADDVEARSLGQELRSVSGELVDGLNMVSGDRHQELYAVHARLFEAVDRLTADLDQAPVEAPYCLFLDEIDPALRRQVGTKAATLARLRRMSLPVPDGFVVTTQAGRHFLNTAQMSDSFRRLLRGVASGQADLAAVADRIREDILRAPLSEDFCQAFHASWRKLGGSGSLTVSARSSGAAEDRLDHSFAGQFLSVLNITDAAALMQAYKEVLASGFSARAIAYRLNARLPLADFDMAVLCQVMLGPRCAGVLLTCDPSFPDNGRMLVSAVPGLGTLAVGGAAPADLYRPSREGDSLHLEDAQVAEKTDYETLAPHGGLKRLPVPEPERRKALLSAEELAELVRFGRIIENLEGLPQDIEWAITREGGLHLLQARPLRLAKPGQRRAAASGGTPLASGACASPGKAVGCVRVARTAEELRAAADDSQGPLILLMPQGIIDAAQHLCKFEGVIVEAGNPADHLACIAREYRVPMITGTPMAAEVIGDGRWVVLDADHGQVSEAPPHVRTQAAEGRQGTNLSKTACSRRIPVDSLRGRLRELTVPLNLTDAYGPTFSLNECRSVHDLVRLAHEMAVLAMFDAGDRVMAQAGGLLKQVDVGVPFHFLVIDLGGALSSTSPRTVLGQTDIRSTPLAAVCEGLATPGLGWHSPPSAAAMGGLFSRALLDARGARPVGSFNYALAARDYLNLNARVEFHFAMLDTVCSGNGSANYIRFRFKGGGTGGEQCRRRARFVGEVLEANGFFSTVTQDMVTASLAGAPRELIRGRLVMLGRLLGFSRLLDAAMTDDQTPHRLAQDFLEGRFSVRAGAGDPTEAPQA